MIIDLRLPQQSTGVGIHTVDIGRMVAKVSGNLAARIFRNTDCTTHTGLALESPMDAACFGIERVNVSFCRADVEASPDDDGLRAARCCARKTKCPLQL